MIKEKLDSANHIVITSHRSPDGDAIGSSLALCHYLQKKGKQVQIIVPDDFADFLKWLSGAENILLFENNEEQCTELINQADIVFSLDYNNLSRVGEMGDSIANSNAYKVLIDHHLEPSDFADWMLSDITICSTAQLIYQFIVSLGDTELIDTTIGEGIYTGLVTDSGSFRFSSVDSQTHMIAAELIKKGLDHAKIHEQLYDVNSLDRLHLLGFALNNGLKVLPNIPVAVIALSKASLDEFNPQKGYTEGIVNYALSIQGVTMAALLQEDTSKVKLSIRSTGEVPVNEFAKTYFEGGGHKNAAGGVSYKGFDETVTNFEKFAYEFMDKI